MKEIVAKSYIGVQHFIKFFKLDWTSLDHLFLAKFQSQIQHLVNFSYREWYSLERCRRWVFFICELLVISVVLYGPFVPCSESLGRQRTLEMKIALALFGILKNKIWESNIELKRLYTVKCSKASSTTKRFDLNDYEIGMIWPRSGQNDI